MKQAWFILLGAWLMFELLIYAGAFGDGSGSVMPWQPFALVFGAIGGLIFFLLTHILIRKLDPKEDA